MNLDGRVKFGATLLNGVLAFASFNREALSQAPLPEAAARNPAGASVDVTVSTLSGDVLNGKLVGYSDGRLRLHTGEGISEVPISNLIEIVPSVAAAPALVLKPEVWINLFDGSFVPATSFSIDSRTAVFTPLGGSQIQVPVSAISSVCFREQTPAIAAEWEKLLKQNRVTDLLVVRRKDALDYLEGTFARLSGDQIAFDVSGERINAGIGKVEGLILYSSKASALPKNICQFTDASGSTWYASAVEIEVGKVRFETPSGAKTARSLSEIRKLDFSAGKFTYFADLEPERVKFSPADEPFRYQMSPAISSGRAAGTLGLMNGVELTYKLPGAYTRLSATIAIDGVGSGQERSAELILYGDGKELFKQKVLAGTDSAPLDLKVGGIKRITISVSPADSSDGTVQVILADLKLSGKLP